MSPNTLIIFIASLFLIVGLSVAYVGISIYQEKKERLPFLTKLSWVVILASFFILIGLIFGKFAEPFLVPQLEALFPASFVVPTPTFPSITQTPVTDGQPNPTLSILSEPLSTPALQITTTVEIVPATLTSEFATQQPGQFPMSTPIPDENLQAICTGKRVHFFSNGIPGNDPCAGKVDSALFVPGKWIVALPQLDEEGNVERCLYSYSDGYQSEIREGAMQVLPRSYSFNIEFQICH